MRLSKKFLLICTLCVVLVAGTLGGFAIASADDEAASDVTRPEINHAALMEKVAEIYERNTGTAIDAAELQKAFEEAGIGFMAEKRDRALQGLLDRGKITPEQVEEWKAWLDARPDFPAGELKEWLESRPDTTGLFGAHKFGKMMPFGNGQRGFGNCGDSFGFGFRNCLPDTAGE